MTTTNPPEYGPEPEPEPEPKPEPTDNLGPNPETPQHYDRYIDDKFLEIFSNEDSNGALARAVTSGLSQNDGGPKEAPTSALRAWWQRAKREGKHE